MKGASWGATDQPLISIGTNASAAGNVGITYSGAGTVLITHDGDDWNTGYVPPADQWLHLAATYDGTTEHFYVNGAPVAQRDISGLTLTAQRLTLGACAWATGERFSGTMDEVRVWTYARSATQIDAGYDRVLGAEQPGLVVSYSLDDGPGQWAANLTAYNHDAMLGTSNVVDPADPAWVPSTAPVH